MTMTYATFVQRLAMKLDAMQSDFNFTITIPEIIEYAEGRCYRDLNLINAQARDTTALTTNTRTVLIPTNFNTFTAIQQVNLITPASTLPAAGTRNPMIKVALDLLDYLVPSETANTGVPTMWAIADNLHLAVGPAPDATYNIEVIGPVMQTPLSSSNTSTLLTTLVPDLFFACAMIHGVQYFAPKKAEAAAWDAEYQTLLVGADAMALRGRYGLAVNQPVSVSPATASLRPPSQVGGSVT